MAKPYQNRDDFLHQFTEEFHSPPNTSHFIQLALRSRNKEDEKYVMYLNPNGEAVAEIWLWDKQKDFLQLTRRENLEILRNGNYSPSLTKRSRIMEKTRLESLEILIQKIGLSFHDFKFSTMVLMNDGPSYSFHVKSLFYETSISWVEIPRHWKGLRRELMLYVRK